jgi:hypothetical protein
MADLGEVRRRVLVTIERAKRNAADRRARAEVAEVSAQRFIETIATPVVQQVVSALRAEGLPYRVSTPAGSVRLMSESHQEDFIDLAVDITEDPVSIMTLVSHTRGRRESTTERVLRPGVTVDELTDEDVLEFLLEALPVFVAR